MAAQGKTTIANNPISEILMAFFVIALILILLIEMPNWVINFSISLNIALGVVLLMFSLFVQKPLELASFPSIILIGTMFRLVLSIASTRLILAKGDAGEVIHAFGTFVTGGNMVVGGVIFLIITVVQFMVITKGAERIAEVSELYHSFNLMVNELSSIQRLQSDFTSVISHEFKTPLSSIQGYAQLLQSPDLTTSERESYQHRIIVATKQLSGLSDNILKLSKLDNQSISSERKPYRLDEQIRESILSLHNQWEEKSLTLTIDLDSTVLYANEDLLNQVWINLLDNAIKYSEQDGQIIVHLKDSKDSVEIIIEDTGIGIPSEKLNIIFERFFQVDGSRFSSGNGLGLAIVKRIIDIHEGTIEYQSELGDGTKVFITIPHKKIEHSK